MRLPCVAPASHRAVQAALCKPFTLTLSLLLAPALVAGRLSAQDPPKPREFSADVGNVSTSGNTEISALNRGERFILRAGP